jgi:hypothetical protein
MRIAIVAAVAAAVAACGAQMNARPSSAEQPSRYGPVSQPDSEGEVQYPLGGLDSIVAGRREDAYKQMFAACNGSYSITHEEDKEGTVASIGPYGGTAMPITYRVIRFKCVAPSTDAAP